MIYNCDLETFYKRIDGNIKLIAAYCEKPILDTIIRACRMKPSSVFEEGKFNYDTILERSWVDEFGIALKLNKKKIELIKTNDKKFISSTDLFYGNNVKTLLGASKAALFATSNEDGCSILTLGQDDYLRYRVFENDKWKIVAPLLLGLDALEKFYYNINKNGLVNVIEIQDMKKCAVTVMPANQNIMKYFDNKELQKIIEEY